jgi:uncharacterized protein with PIN domain
MRSFRIWMVRRPLDEDPPMEADASPKFVVDRTAGRLARWLRILGLDVDYVSTWESSAIAKIARQSGRKLITRNGNLARRLGSDSILLSSEHLDEQIRQVLNQVGPEICDPFSRCNICNVRLEEVAKEQVRGRVPGYVYANHDRFSVCPACGRYYWQGTHWQKMLDEIERITEGKFDGETRDDN